MVDLDNLRQEGWPDAAVEIERLRATTETQAEAIKTYGKAAEALAAEIERLQSLLAEREVTMRLMDAEKERLRTDIKMLAECCDCILANEYAATLTVDGYLICPIDLFTPRQIKMAVKRWTARAALTGGKK